MPRLLTRNRTTVLVAVAVVGALLTVGAAAPARAATPAAASVGVTTSTPTVALGQSVTVDFATGSPFAKDWIAFYSSGAIQSTCPSPATQWAYTSSGTQTAGASAKSSGSVTFNTSGWALGTYSVYLCQNDGYTSIGTPIKISVANLTTASTTVPQGSRLIFGYGAATGQLAAANWIGLYSAASGSTPGHGGSTYWDYTNSGTQTAGGTAVASGTLGFDTTGWPVGVYTAYFLYNDGYTIIGSPITLTVVPPKADVLDVGFASGAPLDRAQGLTAKSYGSPAIANDDGVGAKVATFNGASDAYQYDFTDQYPKLASHFSVECQFRWNGSAIPGGTSAWPSVCSGLQNGGMGLIVYNGKLDFELGVGGYKDIYAAITPGTWIDAIGTWDGTTARLYLDGQLAASGAAAGALTAPTTSSDGWSLGADLSGSGGLEQFAPVSIGVARVFSTAMTADAVAAQYRVTVPSNVVTVTKSGQGTATATPASALAGTEVALDEQAATGYTFTGWKVTSPADGSVTIADDGTFTMPNVPVAVQAIFAAHRYTVHFDGNGAADGTMAAQSLGYDTAALLTSNAFARPGFHFAGWATSADGAPSYTDSARVVGLTADDNGSITLYAVWHGDVPTGAAVPAPTVLHVDFADGTAKDNAQNRAVTTVGAPTIAADPSLGKDVASFDGSDDAYQYDFTGSYPKLAGGLTEECRFRWNGSSFPSGTSTWPSICNSEQNGGGGIMYYNGALQAELYVGGKFVDAIAVSPIQAGRWYDAIETWDGVTLSLYLDGALVASAPASGALGLPTTTSGATPFTVGADLSGSGGAEMFAPVSIAAARVWNTALTAAQVATQSAGTAPHDVTVTSSGTGSAAAKPGSAWVNDEVALDQTAGKGYSFSGWTIAEPASGLAIGTDSSLTMPDSAVTVNAAFTPHSYTVHFDGNGAGSGTMADQPMSYDTAAKLTAAAFSRTGYYFAGWSTSPSEAPSLADGASVVDLTAAQGATVTLYAFWVPQGQYLVRATATGNGTVSASTLTAAPGTAVALAHTAATGYHFTGWQLVAPSDGSVEIAADGSFTMPTEPVNVQGAFAANGYTVTFNGNGSDSGKMTAEPLSYDRPAALTASVYSRDGYVFAGWAATAGGAVAYADGATVSNLTAADGGSVTLFAVWHALTTAPGSWPTLRSGFVTDTLHLPAVPLSGAVSQRLLGLWNGAAPTSFAKVSGDDWLSVSTGGVVSGTAPAEAPEWPAEITVSATNGSVTSQILVEVPVQSAPEMQTASWNAWEDGGNVSDAVGKNLIAVASRGVGVIGFQDGGAAMAEQLGAALGWHVFASGDLGVVSAYPFTGAQRVAASAAVPAVAATIDADGQHVRIWNAYLDESAPDAAARAHEAQAIADAATQDLFAASTTPVVLLGDLGSADLASTFTASGLSDTYRRANPDAATAPGTTWPVFPASAATATRIDYVFEAGTGLRLADSDELSAGRPSATTPAGNSWASDHSAVVTTFTVGDSAGAPTPPKVTTEKSTAAYQIGHGPAGAEAFVTAIGASADEPGSTLTADLGSVDFSTAGWYTAQVIASHDGAVSDPVSVAVRVAPVPTLTLGSTTATFDAGTALSEKAVLGQLAPAFTGDGVGTESVDLSGVTGVGTFPVVVTATDEWGFPATAAASVTVVLKRYTISYDLAGGTLATPNPASYDYESGDITLSNPTRYAYDFAGWTGTDLSGAAKTVKIPAGSASDRAYTATWKQAAASWSAGTAYATAGTTVFYQGRLYESLWWSQGEVPGSNPNGAWAEIGAPATIAQGSYTAWTPSWVYNGGEKVAYDGKLYQAAWYTRDTKPGDPNGPWEQIGAPVVTPKGAFAAWTPSWIYNGGEKVAYQGRLYTAKWYTRNQAPGTANGAWQDLGAY